MIEHIVIESGGYKGLYALGALYQLNKENFYNIENIKTIFGTSIGSYVGVLLCLKMDWDDLLEYFIERPWHNSIKTPVLLDLYSSKGIIDSTFFRISLKNLLLSKDLSLDSTLKDLYEYSKIELHIFTVEVQDFKLIDISYKTHPDMKIIDSVYRSCSIPYIFKPCWANNNYYIDGGVLNDYPVEDCMNNGGTIDNILGLKFERPACKKIDESCNIFDFSRHLHSKLIEKCRKYKRKDQNELKYEIKIPGKNSQVDECLNLLKERNLREEYVNKGKEIVKEFLKLRT
jgi:predicted acylesterase/phospholipase RssA